MKQKRIFFALAVGALLLAGCKSETKPKVAAPDEPQMTLSSYDSTTVRQLVTDFLEHLKQGRIDDVMPTLYTLDGEDVKPLSGVEYDKCRFALNLYQIYDYKITDMIFFKETDSEVKYKLYIQDPATKENPATMNGLIRPVRRDGTWYICLANSETEDHVSEIDKR